jgi:hypothetical protein
MITLVVATVAMGVVGWYQAGNSKNYWRGWLLMMAAYVCGLVATL